jgi:hypothetical protein
LPMRSRRPSADMTRMFATSRRCSPPAW